MLKRKANSISEVLNYKIISLTRSTQQENSGILCPILQLLPCTAFFICSDKIICFGAGDKAAVAGRAEQDTTSAPDLRDATLRPQEADKSGEIPQSWQARAAACTPSLLWPPSGCYKGKPGSPWVHKTSAS